MRHLCAVLSALALALGLTVGVQATASAAGRYGYTVKGHTCGEYGGKEYVRKRLRTSGGTAGNVELVVRGNHDTAKLCYSLRSLNGQTWSTSSRAVYRKDNPNIADPCATLADPHNFTLGVVHKVARRAVRTDVGLGNVTVYASRGGVHLSASFRAPDDRGATSC